jgi:glycosyltransferase involved in cell wall biosynthesis
MNPLDHYLRYGAAARSKTYAAIDLVDKALENFSSAIAELIASTGPIDALILLPIFGRGGTEKASIAYSHVLHEARPNRSILLIVTDFDLVDEQVPLFEGAYVLRLVDFLPSADRQMKQRFLLKIVQLLAPRICYIMNSDIGWSLLRSHGAQLKMVTRLFGRMVGVRIARNYFPDAARYCECLLSDNATFFDEIQRLFPQEAQRVRFKTIYNPVVWSAPSTERSQRTGSRPNVLWAGRLDRQKRIEKLFEVAALTDDLDFYVFGSKVTDGDVQLQSLPNVHYEGPFTSPDQLVEKRFYDAYIHTTWGEGIPNILLEVAKLNIPIVAPAIGGIAELVNDDTGYLIPADSRAREYEIALRAAIADQAVSARRARALRALVESRHSWSNFSHQVKMIDGFT